jgi:hypothetical protein
MLPDGPDANTARALIRFGPLFGDPPSQLQRWRAAGSGCPKPTEPQSFNADRDVRIVEQPIDRGTATAVAHSIAWVARYDPRGLAGVFPGGLNWLEPDPLWWIVEETYAIAARYPTRVFVLGVESECPGIHCTWIEPGLRLDASSPACSVKEFWDRPPVEVARRLAARHCLLHTLVTIGSVDAFRRLMYSSVPESMRVIETAVDRSGGREDALVRTYTVFRTSHGAIWRARPRTPRHSTACAARLASRAERSDVIAWLSSERSRF